MNNITGVILAGGLARRMGGGDKGLLLINGQPLAAWVVDKLRPQVDEILLNANRHEAAYAQWGRVVSDITPDFAGPLAGLHAGMVAANNEWILSAPCDSPFLPDNLATTLLTAAQTAQADIAVAATAERVQPVFMLARRTLAAELGDFLAGGGRKIDRWYPHHRFIECVFANAENFANINTPAELTAAAQKLPALSKT